jgi:hypothetical protein
MNFKTWYDVIYHPWNAKTIPRHGTIPGNVGCPLSFSNKSSYDQIDTLSRVKKAKQFDITIDPECFMAEGALDRMAGVVQSTS